MSKKEEKRKIKVSAARRMAEHTSFDRNCLKIPQGMQLFNPDAAGSYRLEIIPFMVSEAVTEFHEKVRFTDPGKYYYEQTYWNHRGIGPNNDAYVCMAKTFGKPCPICDHRAKLSQDADADEKEIKALAPKERQLFNVYNHAEPDKGVQLWEISFHNFGKHLDKKINNADDEDKEKYQQFADPEDGRTIKVTASKESYGKGTYLEFADIELKTRKEGGPDLAEMVEKAADLPSCIRKVKYEDLKKIFLQTGDDDGDDDDEKPKKKPKDDDDDDDTPPKKKPKDDDDDDDDDVPAPKKKPADDDDDDDDVPAPKKKPADDDEKPKKKPKDDDDGEDPTAEQCGLKLNMEVMHKEHGKCEIVHISGDGTSIRLEDEDGDIHKGIAPRECKKIKKAEEPAKKKPADDDDDDVPAPKKKKPKDDDDDDDVPAPKKKKKPADDDDDDKPFTDDDDDD